MAQPFAHLGPHKYKNRRWISTFQPDALEVSVRVGAKTTPLPRLRGDTFAGPVAGKTYSLVVRYADGSVVETRDPYSFAPVLGDFDQYLLGEGTHKELWRALGAHVTTHEKVAGTHFAVWAPNAQRVSLVGDFNMWDGRRHVMRALGTSGVWEIFMPDLGDGTLYKFEVLGADGSLVQKADPVGYGSQHPPEQASVVRDITGYGWDDAAWMQARRARGALDAPVSIYEAHLGSWRRRYDEGGRPLSYKELARDLIPYVKDLGFTHIELLPISEFPFDGSWGYQPVGLYAPTIRFGPPHEFRDFVDAAHAAGLGVLLDWVPGHFPTDAHGLAHFDGTHLYEHADPREGFHQDWNTLIYNYGRTEVKNYLVANALYWMEEYHLDGLRVDAVASMLYRNYSRNEGEWVPNKDGGHENYEAIAFLQEMNTAVYGAHPDVMTVAEESTSFPGVSRPVDAGGLGFGYKWNMGWMNDTLAYIERDPIYRRYHQDDLTRPLMWQYSENFILPISHDEVVHGKGSMLEKMPGDRGEKFANLRAYYAYMWTHPGKKLLFMGCEFAQPEEWKHDGELNWSAAADPAHDGVRTLIRDLNALYSDTAALHVKDCDPDGFAWLNGDAGQSTLGYVRYGHDGDAPVVIMCNFTPVLRQDFALGVPKAGRWDEVLNTDSEIYGGGNRGNMGGVHSTPEPRDGHDTSVSIVLPPLSVVVLRHAAD
ncbi:1,4-alpha-glucan branching enzyme GlgB [Pseudooctadecabacter jejudonensis]|uniref:1,4-alpha-glucan branching enzyme GlgB n=2 Tax=Pseudooctadecabacter jejudonensis TaxID=1391910 RepID=A0A1Y5SGT7_9RHOB|nr:1,4-alpha-glucan branching protein GlgB [Pseudooctadecabacter jejudonensis]SLN38738.1 1,4-alpha-glucan branching enzyme GlgB [Pseudooctadecabacter jejudonensis]